MHFGLMNLKHWDQHDVEEEFQPWPRDYFEQQKKGNLDQD